MRLKKAITKPLNRLIEPLLKYIYPYIYPLLPKKYWDWRQRHFFNTFNSSQEARKDDYIYRTYLQKYPASRLLDIGCGYGRLFPLYLQLNIPKVIGIDISPYAISKAKHWPNYEVKVIKVEDLDFPTDYFDAAISNHTLSYVPPGVPIRKAVSNIVEQCKSVLLIELTRWQGGRDYSRFIHDYPSLFKGKMVLIEQNKYSPQHDVMIYAKQL